MNWNSLVLISILLTGCEQSNRESLPVTQSENTEKFSELQQKINNLNILAKQSPHLQPVVEGQKTIINTHIVALENTKVTK